uniref:SRP54-type proteins GTP-binding domain-containing protein n=1 Tax=Aegilops tauschii subsp. strangulata TaxID=200361 RepID=A0A453N7Q7_AEGTS
MLEELLIFTRGGLILWSLAGAAAALKGSPIDALVRSFLLEGRSASAGFTHGPHALRWTYDNALGLVFVAVYRRVLHLLYVDDLLVAVRAEFARIYNPRRVSYDEFGERFRQLHLEVEARASRPSSVSAKPGPAASSPGAPQPHGGGGGGGEGEKTADESGKDDSDGEPSRQEKHSPAADGSVNGLEENSHAGHGGLVVKREEEGGPNNGAFNLENIKKKDKKPRPGRDKKPVPKDKKPSEQKLDYSNPADHGGGAGEQTAVNQGKSMMDKDEAVRSTAKDGWFSSMFRSIAGSNAELKESDLQPALKSLKDRLMTKNVAEEIAEKLCESVAASLLGKKLGSFTRISSSVQTAMEEALVRILTPRRSIDVLRDIHAAKDRGAPYVIVFVGVNGVGKSTNLAKVAYWLLQHDVSVTLAACDTFRSGAVEQLRTHARRLQIPIFEKGYERDPAVVAKGAIQEATRNKSDVVLVDTAGRMQDNEPLMRALSKLINLNNPDLVLFVGEALVGNDAVDQLTKFSQKLTDLSTAPTARSIDGILLTKFDTIDDKVGAALSMVYVSGAPVMFVGCGQSYTDLKKLNVKSIVNTLLE